MRSCGLLYIGNAYLNRYETQQAQFEVWVQPYVAGMAQSDQVVDFG